MILTQKGGPFELSVKCRVNSARGPVEYLAADSLQSCVANVYRAAGLRAGYSSHSRRRTYASRMVARGHSLDTVQILFDHPHLDHVVPYLEVSKKARRHAMADLGGVFEED